MRFLTLFLAGLVLAGAGYVAPENKASAYTAAQRAAIRSMPIEQRPNRPGHFYGNTVRRLNKIGR
jgi:hypothetical protein